MRLQKYDARRDANEPEIVKALQKMGVFVTRMAKPVDLLCIHRSRVVLAEVKMEKGVLKPAQKDFIRDAGLHGYEVKVWRTVEEATNEFGGV